MKEDPLRTLTQQIGFRLHKAKRLTRNSVRRLLFNQAFQHLGMRFIPHRFLEDLHQQVSCVELELAAHEQFEGVLECALAIVITQMHQVF